MQRHMQNISFLVIVGVLLSCAFFFSEQTRVVEKPQDAAATAAPTLESREDLPDCAEMMTEGDLSECYQEASAISYRLVENLQDLILAYQADSAGRVAFLEAQQTWEESRDADCRFLQDQAASVEMGEIARQRCLLERNLIRLEQIEGYLCELYDPSACEASVQFSR